MKKSEKKDFNGVKEIARRGNVSIATVDRVIHNRTGVSENTRARIKKIIKDLNYQPNVLAQRLAARKTIRLVSFIPRSSSETSFWEAPLKGINEAAAEVEKFGITVEQYFYDLNSRESFLRQSKNILKSKPDGILLAPAFIEESVTFTEKCKEGGIPYVLMDADLPNTGALSYIGPDLYHTGYLNAHLINFLTTPADKILIVNISKVIASHHYLLQKEEGFLAYFNDRKAERNIIRLDITNTDNKSIEKELTKTMVKHKDIKLIIVMNSRVFEVAGFLEKTKKNVLLIGYDFIPKNIEYLNKEVIHFLICQKPQEQGYKGIITLYQHLALSAKVEKAHFMPIDIITKENYIFYRN